MFLYQVARQKDRLALCQLLPTLIHCENDRAYEDTFLHSLISYLIAFGEEFSNDESCTAVFDDFLLVSTVKCLKTVILLFLLQSL